MLGFSFGVKALTVMQIWCVEGMHMPKVVCNEYNLDVEGYIDEPLYDA